MDRVLIEVPERIQTERLLIRCPHAGDGPALHEAVLASHEVLRVWMPWAQEPPKPEDSEAYCRRHHAMFLLREELAMLIFERLPGGGEGLLLGGTGLHRIDWDLRRFEIGYWRRTGLEHLGIVTETVRALARMAFDALGARRVEIRMDDTNEPSRKVAERAGFTFEAVLRHDAATPGGEPRNTCVYARVRGIEEIEPAGRADEATDDDVRNNESRRDGPRID
jgi:RimJ/RimL family protein N-acetyltransferase